MSSCLQSGNARDDAEDRELVQPQTLKRQVWLSTGNTPAKLGGLPLGVALRAPDSALAHVWSNNLFFAAHTQP